MTKKKFIVSLAVVFFALVLAFTFISNSIYNASLPVVTTARSSRSSVLQSAVVDGEFSYADAYKVTALDNWEVTEVMVKKGDQITEGDVLFTIDVSPYLVQRQNYSDSLLKIANQLKELDDQAENTALDNARRTDELQQQVKLLEYQIRNINGIYPSSSYSMTQRENFKRGMEMDLLRLRNGIDEIAEQEERAGQDRERTRTELRSQQSLISLEMEELERRYPASGAITAEAIGLVDAVMVKEGETIAKGQECVTAHSSKADVIINYTLSLEKADNFETLSTVSVDYLYMSYDEVHRTSVSKTGTCMAEKHTRKMSADGKSWEYQSVMKDMTYPPAAKAAKVTIAAISGYYTDVLPANCVKRDADSEYILVVKEKNSLFGKAYYVEKVEVETKARNNTQVAVTSKDYINSYEIVETTTLPVYPGMTVLVR